MRLEMNSASLQWVKISFLFAVKKNFQVVFWCFRIKFETRYGRDYQSSSKEGGTREYTKEPHIKVE